MNIQTGKSLVQTNYDRSDVEIGIVHIGYGAFHRAHQAVFVDQTMEATGDLRWGIAAVNLRKAEADSFRASQEADDGYLLKTTSPAGKVEYRVIRSHMSFADWSTDPKQAENLLSLESVSVLTITVTESGYYLDENGHLELGHPTIEKEMRREQATSVYAFLANALSGRMASGGKPITIMCCDNIRANGKMLARNFKRYLTARGDDDLAAWVDANATFPCSMVDRITPRTTDVVRSEISDAFPGKSLDPIHGESFIQWVLENHFAGPIPDLAAAGVQIVEDVDPFEEAKIRILNGGHTGMCYVGALAGYKTFDETMRDADLRRHFDGWETENVLPGLSRDLPFDKTEYLNSIAERFENAAIADELGRICMDGWSKMQIFIRPTLEECLAQGISPRHGYDVIASWYVYARRFASGKTPIGYVEPFWSELAPLLEPGREKEFARNHQLWADLPEQYQEFVPGILSAIEGMEKSWPA